MSLYYCQFFSHYVVYKIETTSLRNVGVESALPLSLFFVSNGILERNTSVFFFLFIESVESDDQDHPAMLEVWSKNGERVHKRTMCIRVRRISRENGFENRRLRAFCRYWQNVTFTLYSLWRLYVQGRFIKTIHLSRGDALDETVAKSKITNL